MAENKKIVYEENKYCIQDVSTLYIGTKYTLAEVVEAEDIPFKFRLLVERDILPKADGEDTLETHLYYLNPSDFLVKIYDQLKAKVKVNVIEERKTLFGKRKKEYVTRVLSVKKLTEISLWEKQKNGIVVQELLLSKLALLAL